MPKDGHFQATFRSRRRAASISSDSSCKLALALLIEPLEIRRGFHETGRTGREGRDGGRPRCSGPEAAGEPDSGMKPRLARCRADRLQEKCTACPFCAADLQRLSPASCGQQKLGRGPAGDAQRRLAPGRGEATVVALDQRWAGTMSWRRPGWLARILPAARAAVPPNPNCNNG